MSNESCDLIVGSMPELVNEDGLRPLLPAWQAIFVFIAVAVLSVASAKLFQWLRAKVFRDSDNIDLAFDAGGKVTIGLTATTIVSQWTWAASLLQSSGVAAKYGISGAFWYASGAAMPLFLFSLISVQLKIRAPGAKTFLQVVRARFGPAPHLTFCVFALVTNAIVTALLMLGGNVVLTSLIQDFSNEYALAFTCIVIGSYTYIGGLGATFYVSFLNTAIIFVIMFIFIIYTYYKPDSDILGSYNEVYDLIQCQSTTAYTWNNSTTLLSMQSIEGLKFGIINLIGNFGTVFIDQSYWQSSVAAKPREGVWGFLAGGLVWFSVPFGFATTMGLAYIGLDTLGGKPTLTADEINSGLVAPVVAQRLLGSYGESLIILLVIMAVTSTGSAEVIAVTSIIVYDIYAVYVKPYRLIQDANTCILCGKMRGRMARPRDKCICGSMTFCEACSQDDRDRKQCKRLLKPMYSCKVHGQFRRYNEHLVDLKNWCIVLITIIIIPITLVLKGLEIKINWLYKFMGVLIGSAVAPVSLLVWWSRLSGIAMMAGGISGTLTGLISWLSYASTLPGGLSSTTFLRNTEDDNAMLIGNCLSMGVSFIVTISLSLIMNRHFNTEMSNEVWENTRDIDSPLNPWTELYSKELKLVGDLHLDNRPSLKEVEYAFRRAKQIAITGGIVFAVFFLIIWPSLGVAGDQLSREGFSAWINVCCLWSLVAGIFIVILPPINELKEIRETMERNKVMDSLAATTIPM